MRGKNNQLAHISRDGRRTIQSVFRLWPSRSPGIKQSTCVFSAMFEVLTDESDEKFVIFSTKGRLQIECSSYETTAR